jgi:hypothetical protein
MSAVIGFAAFKTCPGIHKTGLSDFYLPMFANICKDDIAIFILLFIFKK